MKTPDEIKKGLRRCEDKSQCDWCSMIRECEEDESALVYIEQLEKMLEIVRAERDVTNQNRIELAIDLAYTEKERNALLFDLRKADSVDCLCCVHSQTQPDCNLECMEGRECGKPCKCKECRNNSLWEWRGVCAENSKEE